LAFYKNINYPEHSIMPGNTHRATGINTKSFIGSCERGTMPELSQWI